MLSVFVPEISDNNDITIYPIGRDFIATSESNIIYSFDDETLETKDRVSGLDSAVCKLVIIHCLQWMASWTGGLLCLREGGMQSPHTCQYSRDISHKHQTQWSTLIMPTIY